MFEKDLASPRLGKFSFIGEIVINYFECTPTKTTHVHCSKYSRFWTQTYVTNVHLPKPHMYIVVNIQVQHGKAVDELLLRKLCMASAVVHELLLRS